MSFVEETGETQTPAVFSLPPGSTVRDATSRFEEATYRTLKWRLIPFLMLCYVLAYLDRVNVGFAKLQMLGDLSFSEAVYGLGAGLFFVGYFLFEVPSNLLLHRVGARVWITRIMVTWGAVSSLMAFVITPAQFYILRFLLGAAEAGFYPGIIVYLTYWFPSQRRARVLATFQSAIPLSGLLGGALSGRILDQLDGWCHHRGWQWLFLIEALPSVIVGITVFFYLDDGIAKARWLSPVQKDLLMRNIAQEDALKGHVSVREIFTDLRVWGLCALVFGLIMGLYGISFWMPTLLKDTGGTVSTTQVGWLSAIPNLIAIAAMLLFARSSDLKRERRWHVALAALLGALGLALSALFSNNLSLELVSLSLAAAGIMSALPMQWSFSTAFVRGSSAAAAIALINSVGNLAGVVSPPLIGWLKDRTQSTDTGIYVIAGCAVVSAILALSFPARLVDK